MNEILQQDSEKLIAQSLNYVSLDTPRQNFFNKDSTEKRAEALQKLAEAQKKYREFLWSTNEFYLEQEPAGQIIKQIVFEGYGKKGKLVKDNTLVTAVHIIKSDTLSAFALGSEVYISSAFINSTIVDKILDKLVGVLQHEIVHIEEKHMEKQAAPEITKYSETFGQLLREASLPRFHEYDAEVNAPIRMDKAKYNPTYYASSLEKLRGHAETSLEHGNIEERLAIQHGLVHHYDFENSNIEPTPLPIELAGLEEGKDAFTRSVEMSESDRLAYVEQMQHAVLLNYLEFTVNRETSFLRAKTTDLDSAKKLWKTLNAILNALVKYELPHISDTSLEISAWTRFLTLKRHAGCSVHGLISYHNTLEDFANPQQNITSFRQSVAAEFLKTVGLDTAKWQAFARFAASLDAENGGTFYSDLAWKEFANDGMLSSGPGIYFKLLAESMPSAQSAPIVTQNGLEFVRVNLLPIYKVFERIESQLKPLKSGSSRKVASSFHKHIETEMRNVVNRAKEQLQNKFSEDYQNNTTKYIFKYAEDVGGAILSLFLDYMQVWQIEQNRVSGSLELESIPSWAASEITRPLMDFFGRGKIDSEEFDQLISKLIMRMLAEVPAYADYYTILQKVETSPEEAIDTLLYEVGIRDALKVFGILPKSPISSELINERVKAYLLTAPFQQVKRDAAHIRTNDIYKLDPEKHIQENPLAILQLSKPGFVSLRISRRDRTHLTITEKEFVALIYLGYIYDNFRYNKSREEQVVVIPDLVDFLDAQVETADALLAMAPVLELVANQEGKLDHLYEHPLLIKIRDAVVTEMLNNFSLDKPNLVVRLAIDFCKNAYNHLGAADWLSDREAKIAYVEPVIRTMAELVKQCKEFNINTANEFYNLIARFFSRAEQDQLGYRWEMKQVEKTENFQEALDFLKMLIERGRFNVHAMNHIQKNLMMNKAQIEEFSDFIADTREGFISKGNILGAKVMIADTFGERILRDRNHELFEAALTSYEDDGALRSLMAEVWYHAYCGQLRKLESQAYSVAIFKKNGQSFVNITVTGSGEFMSFSSFMDKIYEGITIAEKHYLVRKMLYGKNGLMLSREGRKKVARLLLEHAIVSDENQNLMTLVRQLFMSALSVHTDEYIVDPVKITEPIIEIIAKGIFRKPLKENNAAAIKSVRKAYNNDMTRIHNFISEDMFPTTKEGKRLLQNAIAESGLVEKIDESQAKILLDFEVVNPKTTLGEAYGAVTEILDGLKSHLRGLAQENDTEQSVLKPVDPVEAFFTILESMQILGTRVKQVSPIFVNWPEKYRLMVEESFYKVSSQTKFTALQTFRNEVEKSLPGSVLREIWDNLEEVHDLGDSGSGYKVLMAKSAGEYFALKVAMANASHLAKDTAASMLAIVNDVEKHSAAARLLKSKLFSRVKFMITKMLEWSLEDLASVNYEAQQLLHEQVSGAVYGGKQVEVVTSLPTNSPKVRVMPWISGTHLLDFGNSSAGDQLKTAASEAFIQTLMQKYDFVSVPADFHYGQFIFKDVLYFLDTEFGITFSKHEQKFFELFLSEEKNQKLAIEFLRYLELQCEFEATKGLINAAKNYSSPRELLMELVDAKIKDIPLKWVLLAKGINFVRSN